MNSIDNFVQNYFTHGRTPGMTDFMYVVTSFFDVTTVVSALRFIFVVLIVAFLICKFRNIRYSFLFVLTIFVGGIITYFLKIFFDVSRPSMAVISVLGQSFPSYHAVAATIFFLMLIYIFDDYFKKPYKYVFNFVCIFGIFLIAGSRVYLGVHWVSDVFWGIILGVGISYIAVQIFRYFFDK